MPTAEAEIADFGGRRTLVVERFDRRWTKDGRLLRLPQEDMCQALSAPPTRKYQSDGGPGLRDIIEFLRGGDRPDKDIATLMRACILFWMLGATDGPSKNFSIAMSPGGRFRLTPLYDVLTAQPSLVAGQIQQKTFKLAMSVGKNRHYPVNDIMPRHFIQTAALAGVGAPLMRGIFADLCETAVEKADAVIASLPPGFPEQLVTSARAAVQARTRLIEKTLKEQVVPRHPQ